MNTTTTHILGFPRMGEHRELKFALEKYWRGETDAAALESVASGLRERHWQLQRDAGLDLVTVGDFAFYDHVLNHIELLGCEPARFGFTGQESDLARHFTMARGVASEDTHCGCSHAAGHGPKKAAALEMTKWFDTNYHYLVPEFDAQTVFRLNAERLLAQVREARAAGHQVKAVLLGPLSFLWLGKSHDGTDRLSLLPRLLPVYTDLLGRLRAEGAEWVQIDEPILGLDLPDTWRHAFDSTYWMLNQSGARILLATYFSTLGDNLRTACQLPCAGLHIDAVRAPEDLVGVLDWLPAHKVLSLGVIDGRNVWRSDLDKALALLHRAAEKHRGELWIAPSCSLLHVPFSLAGESSLDPEVRDWLAFACEKLNEITLLKVQLGGEISPAVQWQISQQRAAIHARRSSIRVHRPQVAQRLAASVPGDDRRAGNFLKRQQVQRAHLQLPLLPTTTIGSFPQTADIRAARAAFKRGELDTAGYRAAMQKEIELAVRKQEALDIDVLVHGEAERNDMVEYFGEQLDGFSFTSNGWVQSYGSRCVKPPIIHGDVQRPAPMTVEWTRYAQSLTTRPMKGMLTGPVTILQWSFVRDDQPRALTCEQIAWAIRDEVVDLEKAGIAVIQIDEPALREGLPLRRAAWQSYLDGATRAFRISAGGVQDATQIHTHMCYAEFNDILPAIAALDADVITIETSRSAMELLRGFGEFRYPNEIGPGVYDIHSPNVPTQQAVEKLLRKAMEVVPVAHLWVNPDCGLKTRGWAETEAALAHMVAAAKALRVELQEEQAA